jgi:large subunit ribosomal protein L15
MFLHDLKSPSGSRKRRNIVGRGPGSGQGKTCGRGQKGGRSRSGRWVVGSREGGQSPLIQRLPKVGFRSKAPILYQVVDVEFFNKFANGTVIDRAFLKSENLIESINRPFKILGNGEVKKSVIIREGAISKVAKEKILKAGGKVELVDVSSAKKK